jgi:hypothetical protein
MKLAQGYSLQETLNGARVLKRPGGYVLTTFGIGVSPKNIQRIAEADEKQLQATKQATTQAIKAQSQFGSRGDPQNTARFNQAAREARKEYLQALEAAYRE